MPSKLDLAAIAAVIVCGVLWVERGQRVSIHPPTPADTALHSVAAAACPGKDSVPYSQSCIEFLSGQIPGTVRTAHIATRGPKLNVPPSGAACPTNDSIPYPSSCIAFMSGWFWQTN